jgi:hypothetical protein
MPDHPAGNFKQTNRHNGLWYFVVLAVRKNFRPPYFRFNARSRADLGLGIPLVEPNLVLALVLEHLVNDAAEMAAEGTDRLVVLLSFASFLFVIGL